MILETSRLILRDPIEKDVASLSEYHADQRYLEHYTDAPDTKVMVKEAITWASEIPRLNYQLMVALRSSKKVIGCVGLRQHGCARGAAEVGIELAPRYWGFGYASEAINELTQYGANTLGLNRLMSETSTNNMRAHKLLMQLGFSKIGSRQNQSIYEVQINAA